MALITEKILQQNFETVLYKIATILFIELTNQKTEHNNMPDFSVFIERMTPYDKAEDVVINVTSANVNYGSFNEKTAQGGADFNIEFYSPLEHTAINASDDTKTFTLHKVAGIVRYILSSTKYVILGLPPGYIGGTYVNNIQFYDDFNNKDGANIRMAILNFSVRINENQNLAEGLELVGNDSQIKLYNTDLGYKLIKNT